VPCGIYGLSRAPHAVEIGVVVRRRYEIKPSIKHETDPAIARLKEQLLFFGVYRMANRRASEPTAPQTCELKYSGIMTLTFRNA